MGRFFNPGNAGFESVVSYDYVDKTGLISLVNTAIGTPRKLVCVTRPRRFGKSFAARSLVAYYSCGCDSHALFDDLDITSSPDFERHLNSYNVISLDTTEFLDSHDLVSSVTSALLDDLRGFHPQAGMRYADQHNELVYALYDIARDTGRRFIFVIDEWDAPLRTGRNQAHSESWLNLLRTLFKNGNFTDEVVAAAYITGILPIKRYGTQSALSDFREYTMLNAADYAPYVGFTEDEVETLSRRYGMPMEELRRWYDGYMLPGVGHVYAPFSVMQACERRRVDSYWTSSESFESLRLYIDLDFDGLQQSVVQALGGAEIPLRTGKFQNDMSVVSNADDVLTLLVHLGYLAYDPAKGTARVPNEEVRSELRDAMEESRHEGVARIVRDSDALMEATWAMDCKKVAESIERVHNGYSSPLFYNGEQALRAVVKAAYISAADYYASIDELPGGHGYADIVFIPKKALAVPAMLVELKWANAPEAAIAQIRGKRYPDALENLDAPLLLVGITYDPKMKSHTCTIEEA